MSGKLGSLLVDHFTAYGFDDIGRLCNFACMLDTADPTVRMFQSPTVKHRSIELKGAKTYGISHQNHVGRKKLRKPNNCDQRFGDKILR